MKPLRILLDGPNLAHARRHAIQLYSSRGRPTGVLVGFLSTLNKLMRTFDPDEIMVMWETTYRSWRYDVYKNYKRSRNQRIINYTDQEQEDWEQFRSIQLPDVMHCLRHLGIRQLRVPLLEADDLLGYIATSRQGDESDYLIVSSDKDMLQLVRRYRCRVYNPHTEDIYYQASDGSLRKSGASKEVIAPSPYSYLIWRSVIGDTSDDIHGVDGVGEKTMAKAYWGLRGEDYEHPKAYLEAALPIGKKGEAIKKALEDGTIGRNLQLMGLGDRFAPDIPERDGATQAKAFIQACRTTSVKKRRRIVVRAEQSWPLFLRYKLERDPNPFLVFLRIRDFDLGYYPHSWAKFVEDFRTLYKRRQHRQAGGWRLPSGEWDVGRTNGKGRQVKGQKCAVRTLG